MAKKPLKKASLWAAVTIGTLALISVGTFAFVSIDKLNLISIGGERTSGKENEQEAAILGNVRVNVVDENGEGIRGAVVTLYIEEGKSFDEKFSSGRDGYVAFDDVPLGNSAFVYVEAEGYISDRFYYTGNPRIPAKLDPKVSPDESPLNFDPEMRQNNFSELATDSSENDTKSVVQLSEERALELVQTWLNSKNHIFNSPYDISTTSSILYIKYI